MISASTAQTVRTLCLNKTGGSSRDCCDEKDALVCDVSLPFLVVAGGDEDPMVSSCDGVGGGIW